MKLLPLAAFLMSVSVLSAPRVAVAQDDATKIMVKMRQLDILNQILPVLMTPQQINKILPAIERSRAAEKKLQASELDQLKKMESKIDPALKDAREKNLVPSKELQTEVILLLKKLSKDRALMILEQNEAVVKAVEETLDEGQIKAAANAITIPDAEVGKLQDRARLSRWVRAVLMDPIAYDILVELSRKSGS